LSPYQTDAEALAKELKTDVRRGISNDEAAERLKANGRNELAQKKKKTFLQRFLAQFKDVMIIILLVAAAVSFAVAISQGDSGELIEPVLILVIVILNALMGVMQESKAEKALDALQSLSAPHARVIRSGVERKIDSKELVVGDIVLLEAGDFIPADLRLFESASFKSEESALTGESVPSDKDAKATFDKEVPLGDRANMAYSGCSVSYGRGRGIVVSTGMNTEMGKIAGLLEGEKETQTPLQKRLAHLGVMLGYVALAACAIVFVVGLINGLKPLDMFMVAVSLAVSAIPEGLPAIVTIVLSMGVTRMVKRNAIIRRLPAVETLGSASVICSDKTGTLTLNRMTLMEAYSAEKDLTEKISNDNTEPVRRLLMLGTLCSDGSVVYEDDKEKHLGDPTETSIVLAAMKNSMTKQELAMKYPRLGEIPFDSDRKCMTTIHTIDGRLTAVVKGGFDVIKDKCVSGDLEKAERVTNEMSARALRVLAVAVKELKTMPEAISPETMECGLTLVGLVGMIDPPRPEAREAVKVCRAAGIKPVMITGDHVVTASAIARDLGILQDGDRAITGMELAKLSDEAFAKEVSEISVYARVSPEDKIRIVKAWQNRGQVVSMTGDGVNDAPALKAADIGCAMGITGTDVAKGAADMTLTDDRFDTIVEAVREGRGIYDNIKKAVAFLLGTNIGEVITVFAAMMALHVSPLLSMQLLMINLVTDSLPALALGMEAVEPDVMNRPPKPKDESIFAHGLGVRIAFQGLLFAALTLLGFLFGTGFTFAGLNQNEALLAQGRTMAFIVLALTQVFHAFNMRSDRSLFKVGVFTNKYLTGAAALSILLVALVVFVPFLQGLFGLTALSTRLYLIALGLSLAPIPVLEICKLVGLIKHHEHHEHKK
jgi:Ca2+-transporting ATPase